MEKNYVFIMGKLHHVVDHAVFSMSINDILKSTLGILRDSYMICTDNADLWYDHGSHIIKIDDKVVALITTDIVDEGGDEDLYFEGLTKTSRRAERRKATDHHHHKLEKIASYYPSEDSDKKNLKKRCRESRRWYEYDDLRKDPAKQELTEARKIADYIERKDAFDRLVEAFLNKSSDITIVEDGNVFFDDFDEEFSFNTSTLSDEDLVFVDPHMIFDEAELEYLRSLNE